MLAPCPVSSASPTAAGQAERAPGDARRRELWLLRRRWRGRGEPVTPSPRACSNDWCSQRGLLALRRFPPGAALSPQVYFPCFPIPFLLSLSLWPHHAPRQRQRGALTAGRRGSPLRPAPRSLLTPALRPSCQRWRALDRKSCAGDLAEAGRGLEKALVL